MALLLGTIGEISELRRSRRGELSIEWRICDFSSLSDDVGNCFDSPLFGFGDGCWSLRLFPNGVASDFAVPKWVGLGLSRKDSGPSTTVHFSIGVGGLEKKIDGEGEFSKYDDALGWNDICPRQLLKYPDNVLTVTCDLKLDAPSTASGVEELINSMQSLLESGKDSDVIIKVQDKEFPAHRLLLRARSPVFEAMFSHDMVEKNSGLVTMKDCDPETFPDFLRYVYTGSVEMISSKNVFSLYSAADMYDLDALKVECGEFIKENVTVDCFCDVITLAVKHGDRALVERATEFFCDNSFRIIKTSEWQVFLAENPTVGNELFIKLLAKHEDVFGAE